jgi:SnoaL-like domain
MRGLSPISGPLSKQIGDIVASSRQAYRQSIAGMTGRCRARRDGKGFPRFRSMYGTINSGRSEIIVGSIAGRIEMDDRTMRLALERHWQASDANDFDTEHEIYREDAVLDYPQSGERIRGRHNIQESRTVQPNKKRFTVRRIVGSGDLWVTEFVLTYDGVPSYTVSIMEFRDGRVAHETQYFADRFEPGPSRAHLVERVDATASS